jgi:hypothetical protein
MPKLSPIPLPLWSPLELIYETTVETEEDLIARILAAREAIENRARICKFVFLYKVMHIICERKDG